MDSRKFGFHFFDARQSTPPPLITYLPFSIAFVWFACRMYSGAPSSRRQVIRGSGLPWALQYRLASSPSLVTTSPVDSSSLMSGGTEIDQFHPWVYGSTLHSLFWLLGNHLARPVVAQFITISLVTGIYGDLILKSICTAIPMEEKS